MSGVHQVSPSFEAASVYKVAIVGAGGTGSQMVTCFARLAIAIRHLTGKDIDVTVFDPDRVSPANIGRQLFLPGEIGANKAVALVTRANYQFGFNWKAVPAAMENAPRDGSSSYFHMVVTCVDTIAARLAILKHIEANEAGIHYIGFPLYWLDVGNKARSGQAWLGQIGGDEIDRLETIIEAFPDQYDAATPEDDTPSCSLAEALRSQDLFVNDHAARYGIDLAERLFRYGRTNIQGWFYDLDTGASPVYVPDDHGDSETTDKRERTQTL